MWQKIKKGLQVFAIIGIIYFIHRIVFVHCPNEDIEKTLASLIGCFALLNLFIEPNAQHIIIFGYETEANIFDGYFEDMANEYDLEFLQTASSVEALEWMNTQEDPLVICSMGPGLWTREGHYIVLWDVAAKVCRAMQGKIGIGVSGVYHFGWDCLASRVCGGKCFCGSRK